MGALAFYALIMGFIPQLGPSSGLNSDHLLDRLGWRQITSSWPFTFIFLLTTVALGATVFRSFSRKRLVFCCNHLGLWLLFLAAGLGAADRQRAVMNVPEGGLEWRAREGEAIKEMDLAIRLDDFHMEEYPAQLALVDSLSGRTWPPGAAPALLPIDPDQPAGQLKDYVIKVESFLAKAVPIGDDRFVRAIMDGASQAAHVQVHNLATHESFSGWVTPGNGYLPPYPLPLGQFAPGREPGWVLTMTRPEPKLFQSKVKVYTKEGVEVESTVRVNHPLRAGDWLIYQRDYDTLAGPASSWSGFELVKDPWLPMAYAGFLLWTAGCCGLIIKGGPNKGDLGLA
jgi:hypothetical protein